MKKFYTGKMDKFTEQELKIRIKVASNISC